MRRIASAVLLSILLCGCGTSVSESRDLTITNPVEVTAVPADMSGYEWIGETVGDFQDISWSDMFRIVEEKGSGVIYIGRFDCDFCQRAVPVLNQAVLDTGITCYVVDLHNGQYEDYRRAEELISETFDVDSSGQPVFYVPEVFGIKNGVFTGSHVSLVDGFVPSEVDEQMSDAQVKKLYDLYLDIIKATAD